MIPRLKPAGWERVADGVRIVLDPRETIELADPDGAVTRLLELLGEGDRTVSQLAAEVARSHPAVGEADVTAAIEALDGLRLVENADRACRLGEEERLRHFSSLAFLRTFADLGSSAEDMVAKLRASHVLMLGVGGLGSNVLQNLCGLGVGRFTLVDRDVVEPRNFARQFVYRSRDVARVKVERAAEWVREFDPAIEVEAIQADFTCAEDVAKIVDAVCPDAVSDGVDSPAEIDQWVNDACVGAGVPFCRGGMYVTEGILWSVDPGRSACYQCRQDEPADADATLRAQSASLFNSAVSRINRGAGPVATLLGSLQAFELTRFLTGFAPPAYAGRIAVIDLARDCAQTVGEPTERNPGCSVCGDALHLPRR